MDNELNEMEERLAEAQAQIESLQAAAADATARAATVQGELETARSAQSEAVTLAETAAAEAEALRSRLATAAAQYRAARLAATPEVPAELVPEGATVEEIDAEMEAALRVVEQLRERIQKEALAQRGATRVPAGSPSRREPDLAGLPASEKIRVGLQQLSEREVR